MDLIQWEISRIQFMEVRKRTIFWAELWGYSLKFRPYIGLIYRIGTSNLGS